MTNENRDRLRSNIGDAIMGMRKEGTRGASLANLRQLTSTKGLSFANPNQWVREFDEHAPEVAKLLRFTIL